MPSLSISDIEPAVPSIPREAEERGRGAALVHEQPTSGIVYTDVGFNLFSVPQQYLQLLPLFSRALTEMGTEAEDYIQLNQRIACKRAGVDVTFYTSRKCRMKPTAAWMFVRSKTVASKYDDLLGILETFCFGSNSITRTLLQMALEEKASEEAHLVPGGHSTVRTRLLSRFCLADWISEQMMA